MPTTWEEAAEETAATLKRDVIQKWTEANVDPLNATRQVLARMGDEPGQYPAVQGFRHIAENGIVGSLKMCFDPPDDVVTSNTIAHVVQTIIKKQHDYGHGNIEAYGRLGLLVRLSDKCARIENLVKRGSTGVNESLEDSWLDIAGYGIIGCMWEDGSFLLPLKNDLMAEGYADVERDLDEELQEAHVWEMDVREVVVDVLVEFGLIKNVTKLERAAE